MVDHASSLDEDDDDDGGNVTVADWSVTGVRELLILYKSKNENIWYYDIMTQNPDNQTLDNSNPR